MYRYDYYIRSSILIKKLEQLKKKNSLFIKLKKGNKMTDYFNIPLAFDVETSQYIDYESNIKEAYMYIWQIGIFDDSVYGRSWNDFKFFIKYLLSTLKEYEIRESKIICWVANLGFEFQFLRKHFEISNLFAKEERHPICFCLENVIEFRDALSYSGGSLDFLAKSFTHTQKLVDSLNYSLMRTSSTTLHMNEYSYCNNDVIILCEFASYVYELWKNRHYIPLTKTGILRYQVKQKAKESYKLKYLEDYVRNLFPRTKEEYLFIMTYLFRGGYTHALSFYVDKLIESDMRGIDFESSYPSVMLKNYVPKTRFKEVKIKAESELKELCKNECVVFIAIFHNIKAKHGYTVESKNRIIKDKKAIYDNGRLYSAESVKVYLTELDYLNYIDFYEYSSMEIEYVATAKRGHIPEYLLDPILEAYCKKQKLKLSGLSDTREYAIQKSTVNSGYGLTVTRLVFKDIRYKDDEWCMCESDKSYDEQISKQILSPFWGIYVTAHARRNELKTLANMCGDVIYSDTDSHKLLNYEKHKNYIDEYNSNQRKLNKRLSEKYNIDFNLIKNLGCFSDEGKISRFKTIGTKRYAYENVKGIHTVVSGARKKSIIDYANNHKKDVFEVFSDGLVISKEDSQKLTTCYNDSEHSRLITDYEGNSEQMSELSSVCLYSIPFSMNLDKDFKNFLLMLEERKLRYES